MMVLEFLRLSLPILPVFSKKGNSGIMRIFTAEKHKEAKKHSVLKKETGMKKLTLVQDELSSYFLV
jgi:hypothetical protein